jgi:hypothetical protein
LRPFIPKLRKNPTRDTAAKTPKGITSPFGWTRAAREKRLPERKGPTARPAAERVWARPLRAPKTPWSGAEFVICKVSLLV